MGLIPPKKGCTKNFHIGEIEILYNHKSNAGNTADVWKHEVLLRIAEVVQPQTYFETHCGYPFYNKGRMVFSSYMKVRKHHKCTMTLCDTDKNIKNHMPIEMDFNFLNVDGWAQIGKPLGLSDLYFIDPPYESMMDFLNLAGVLEMEDFTRPVLAWYPMIADLHPVNYEFGLPKLEYRFNDGKLIGCGMVFKNISEHTIEKVRYGMRMYGRD